MKDCFIVDVLPNGRLVKRYYKQIKRPDGTTRRVFYAEKELNLAEKIKHSVSSRLFPKSKQEREKRKKIAVKLIAGTSALLIASSIGLGAILFNEGNNRTEQREEYFAPITMVDKSKEDKKDTKKLNPPEVKTYTSNGLTYLYYDSAIEIAKYNYEMVVDELNKYNASASEKDKYHFNPEMFDPAVFVAAQVQESSLLVYDAKDGEYKGSYKIGSDALDDANKVANKLYGRDVASSTSELYNPIVASRACMYYYIANYEYLFDEIKNNKLNTNITQEMVVDTYLYGIGNISKELRGGGYKQKFHSSIIQEYAKVLREYYNKLYVDKLISVEHKNETVKMRNKLFEISNKYLNELE